MLKKYATLEQAKVLDIKGSTGRVRTASLDKLSDFEDYRTEDGYLYARIRAISSRVNKNHDGWPSVELAGGQEQFNKVAGVVPDATRGFTVQANKNDEYGFSTFLGKPIFVDHNNSDPKRARGVIVDAKLHVEDHKTAAKLDPYYASAPDNHMPPTWVELLLEVDAKSFPKLAKAIIEGSQDSKKGIDGFSMGCDVEKSVCSICKNAATSPDEYCKHVKLKGAEFDTIDKHGHKTSAKSYEDCYGVRFFEISAVFDPADETALIKEVRSSVEHEGAVVNVACPHCGDPNAQFSDTARYGHCAKCGNSFENSAMGVGNQAIPMQNKSVVPPPASGPQQFAPGQQQTFARSASVHLAENPLPQADMQTAPEYVDTLREEEICPVCGSDMEEGHQCDVCGYVSPPDGLDNPDLDKANEMNELQDTQELDNPTQEVDQGIHPSAPDASSPMQPPQPNLQPPTASVTSGMAWNIYHPRLSGQINPQERPIQTNPRPGTNEPYETIISDQTKPVTNRTAASMIAAVNKETNMQRTRTAADAPTPDTKADLRVDVNGVGGVMDASNESASKPEDKHGNPGTGQTVDVEGKGAVMQGTNEEASRPDHVESLPTAGKDSDDSGFNKKKNIPEQHTQTFPNSNEPGSAVTNKAFPTSHIVEADGKSYYTDDGGLSGATPSKGVEPIDPVGKADDRVDVSQEVHYDNPQHGTDQWTGTDGNGVTKQQDPVTTEVYAPWTASVVDILKIAEVEVELGITAEHDKFERIAELEKAGQQEIITTAKVLARVRTAGLRKNASTSRGGVGRVPSFQQPARTASVESTGPDEGLFW